MSALSHYLLVGAAFALLFGLEIKRYGSPLLTRAVIHHGKAGLLGATLGIMIGSLLAWPIRAFIELFGSTDDVDPERVSIQRISGVTRVVAFVVWLDIHFAPEASAGTVSDGFGVIADTGRGLGLGGFLAFALTALSGICIFALLRVLFGDEGK